MEHSTLTRQELSLLLYLETRAVDHSGRVDSVHMNAEDFGIVERWNNDGFVSFGRISSKNCNSDGSHWCQLSEDAWKIVGEELKARAKRKWENRRFKTTQEKREEANHGCDDRYS